MILDILTNNIKYFDPIFLALSEVPMNILSSFLLLLLLYFPQIYTAMHNVRTMLFAHNGVRFLGC